MKLKDNDFILKSDDSETEQEKIGEKLESISVDDFWRILGMHMTNDPKKADDLVNRMNQPLMKEKEGK